MRKTLVFLALCVALPAAAQQKKADPLVERGRYLIKIAGCNDCHTADYPLKGGKVPEKEWLTGDALGWRGPWGTTYPTNLRLYMQDLTEEQWLQKAKTLMARPPMPWFNVRDMTTRDQRRCTATSAISGPPASRRRRMSRRRRRPRGRTCSFLRRRSRFFLRSA